MTYEELIKQCPAIGDILAEFENRISYLENAMPGERMPEEAPVTPKVTPAPPSSQEIEQLTAKVRYLSGQYQELANARAKSNRYEKYV